MSSLLAKVIERGIFRVPARRKRKVEDKPLLWSNLNGHFDRVFSPRQGT
ncbi:prophage protein NinE [Klebsiella pneumoniae]|nr:hypothetical protein [Klebsiella pneumoniae]SYC08283.1 prophage protein NinE [Klebsiella pneumoniae]